MRSIRWSEHAIWCDTVLLYFFCDDENDPSVSIKATTKSNMHFDVQKRIKLENFPLATSQSLPSAGPLFASHRHSFFFEQEKNKTNKNKQHDDN